MNYVIIWSSRAKIEFAALLLYLKTDFGDGAVEDCISEVERILKNVSQFPFLFASLQDKPMRKAVVNKHLSIFYRIQNDQVELITFWDNKRNLKKLKL